MKSIGVKILKDNLSKYLQLVKNGETIIITEREKIIAEIKSPFSSKKYNKTESFLLEEERKGLLVKATKTFSEIEPNINKKGKIDNIKNYNWKKVYKESKE